MNDNFYNKNIREVIIIEEAQYRDSKKISEIHESRFFKSYGIEYIQSLIENDLYLNLVAKKENTIIAFIIIQKVLDVSEIITIAVIKNYEGLGICHKLILDAIDRLKKLNVKSITLEVSNTNLRAINLYSKNNFKKKSLRKNYYTDRIGKKTDAYLYEQKL
jgi:ribosomal-protein-alanine N-acetyltransferase|tara:strand:+ start:777 stop:1259 length:483 start_codon:yes stop_codon:yes gene_type:complete